MPRKRKGAFRSNKYVRITASEPAPDAATTSSADAPDNTTSSSTTTRNHQSPTTTASSGKLSASMLEGFNLVSGLESSSPDSVLIQTNLILNLLTRLVSNSILCVNHPKSKLTISVVPVLYVELCVVFNFTTQIVRFFWKMW